MNRVCLIWSENGGLEAILSDEPIACYAICNALPNDRVFQYEHILKVGVDHVTNCLQNSPVGHNLDGTLGACFGPKKKTPKPTLRAVK